MDNKTAIKGFEVQYWLPPTQLEQIEYASYWNDEEKEKGKAWYVLDGDVGKMDFYLQQTGLLRQLYQAIDYLRTLDRQLSGVGADLASGNLWAVSHLINAGNVEKVYCVEYSHHRLLKLGPMLLKHYHISREKAVLCLGTFYELKLPSQSLDFVLLAQAFHHADRPDDLLAETRRVLKPNGVVLIIGEHVTPALTVKTYAKHLLKFVISTSMPEAAQRRVLGRTFSSRTLLPNSGNVSPDEEMGDHYYSDREYYEMFSKHGFTTFHHIVTTNCDFQGFVLISNG